MNTTQTKHTPGPWKMERFFNPFKLLRIIGVNEHPICEVALTDTEQANAAFIVQACNWHDEAREALTEIALICEQDNDNTNWQDILRRANSALEGLRKAEGRTQQ